MFSSVGLELYPQLTALWSWKYYLAMLQVHAKASPYSYKFQNRNTDGSYWVVVSVAAQIMVTMYCPIENSSKMWIIAKTP